MKTKITLSTLLLCSLFVSAANAQFYGSKWVVTDLPPNEENTRFYNDITVQLNRPALSVVGFDNGNDHSKGYGLKQILNQAYVSSPNEQKELLVKILAISTNSDFEPNPISREDYQTNSNILQYRAFEALASYVLEQNGENPSSFGIPMRDHDDALAAFKDDILALSSAGKLANVDGDYVKNVRTFGNIARALDLYLALENAYKYWDYAEWNNPNSQVLLSSQQKNQLFGHFNERLENLDSNHVTKHHGLGVNEDETEPGNRPLKGYMALGYAALGTQKVTAPAPPIGPDLMSFVSRARHSGSFPASQGTQARMKKWMYQTDDGKRFWAEGQYYFNFALMDVLPFWHAIRANNMLGTVSDPFHNSWFLNPVEWLADTSTPDGLTAPINDGNKHRISAAPLLRWNPVYGDATVGGKFQSIYETKSYYRTLAPAPLQQNVYFLPDHTWLLELAIPKATTAIPIEYDISDSDEEQLIIRQRDGQDRLHYVYLNAEGHNNIVRGEGHQQPDNMSLLYYVDDASYLMDTGYDRAKLNEVFPPTWTKSTWNNYTDHNVSMIAQPALGPDILNPGNPESGMRFPRLVLSNKRVVSDHQPVDTRAYISENNLSAVFSQTDLKTFDESGSYSTYADYFRFSLFVNDPDRPYLIDMNFGYPLSSTGFNQLLQFRTTYHINSNNLLFTPQQDQFAFFTDIGQYSDRYLFIKPALVERAPVLSNSTVIQNGTALEFFESIRPEHSIKKLNIYSQGPDENPNGMVSGYTGVAFIEAHIGLSTSDAQNKTFLYNHELPEPRFNYPTGTYINAHQAWTWQRTENIVDLLVVRSAFAYYPHPTNAPSPDDELTMDGFSFNPSIQVSLEAGKAFGFIRFVKESDQWVVDENFKLHLNIPVPPPLSVQIQGANSMTSSEIQDFTASISDGTLPYTYEWSKQENSGPWQTVSNNSAYTVIAPSSDFTLKLTITDGNNETAVSDEHHVVVDEPFFSKVDTPDEFSLDGNYPNPFNPSTNINFGLPEQAAISINVYNMLGQRVATLINSTLDAGYHTTQFDASRLASGIYIVKIQAIGNSGERFNSTRQISLVK